MLSLSIISARSWIISIIHEELPHIASDESVVLLSCESIVMRLRCRRRPYGSKWSASICRPPREIAETCRRRLAVADGQYVRTFIAYFVLRFSARLASGDIGSEQG